MANVLKKWPCLDRIQIRTRNSFKTYPKSHLQKSQNFSDFCEKKS